MIEIIKARKRHFSDFGWLKSYWLFSFQIITILTMISLAHFGFSEDQNAFIYKHYNSSFFDDTQCNAKHSQHYKLINENHSSSVKTKLKGISNNSSFGVILCYFQKKL
ncbi:MAG: hypothetical protein GY760_07600 [Deltaproteobacteria bacterium]|nr:hypothetical protein [Deltaproteobacteria bacterium]